MKIPFRQYLTPTSIEEAYRLFGMKFILTPACHILPKKFTLRIAGILAAPLLAISNSGVDNYWSFRQAFVKGRVNSTILAWRWLAQPFRDFVTAKRIVNRLDTAANLEIVEKNIDGIDSLRQSKESYIIVCGHFAREAAIALYCPSITPGQILHVTVKLPSLTNNIHDLRLRAYFSTLLNSAYAIHGGNLKFVFTDAKSNPAKKLYSYLMKPGSVAVINIDAPHVEHTGSFCRPFAGSNSRAFALGAVRLARLTGCAIISCCYFKEKDGTLVLNWGEPIKLVRKADRSEDIYVMNQLLDGLEIEVGRRPTEYVFNCGSERLWRSDMERWQDL